ncbi:MAG: hypothetical protein ACLTPR_03745 [Enterococcus canintestini]|uniref:hypothetical protein n=1 Tax=Enterococcus canintestini TaxID=317010 RepID=UPI003996302B|nr:hypothetical protein [Enterococcus faecalis]HBI1565858.1 hypothetical protein [Enterococcus faecalis]HBI1770173.1 hypothetical protein [Enterococcus faecalis]
MNSTKLPENYLIVEFNERSNDMRTYKGEIVTLHLISQLQILDEAVKNEQGYYKFYFDEIVNGEIINHYRIDIGDGFYKNKKMFEFLAEKAVDLKQLYSSKPNESIKKRNLLLTTKDFYTLYELLL